ncbi:hypothetical protein [[Mycobacterium] vasticus]|uniref:Uncharacterized protein n=1 Tax=[Mycobacterium] vasticus TaxID=2875777 RepID=A0ABU5Z270_9MYCO|nr:hypothetical protein [Mycolicibacter sp. MYC017]MEB3071500.1 hypothetical protein [Mycolicibacter sp. MYC017]
MSTANRSQTTTRTFARVIGPFLAIMMATAAARAPELWPQVASWSGDTLWTWSVGAFTLIAGLVVIALHPYWRGVAAFSISGLGWLTAVKGAMLVAFPTVLLSAPADTMGSIWVFRIVYVALALLGLYLTYIGWAPGDHGHAAPEGKAEGVLRRAA